MPANRREFLKAVGGVAVLAVGGPARARQKPSQTDEAVMGGAQERIRRCRMGTAVAHLAYSHGSSLLSVFEKQRAGGGQGQPVPRALEVPELLFVTLHHLQQPAEFFRISSASR